MELTLVDSAAASQGMGRFWVKSADFLQTPPMWRTNELFYILYILIIYFFLPEFSKYIIYNIYRVE